MLKKKIQRWGQFKPILVTKEGEVIGGNMRLRAYKELGIEDVWVSIVEPKSEAEKTEIAIADNESSGEWDILKLEELAVEFKDDINLDDYKIDLDGKWWGSFLPEEEVVEDEAPEVDEDNVVSKLGEVYQLGRHRLMCGDSTKVEDVERLMDGKKADLLLTDPPYNVAYEGKTKDALKIENDSMKGSEFREFLRLAFTSAEVYMKPGASFYIWHADSEGFNFRGACKDIGLQVRQCIIWNKNSMVMGRQDYHWKHEPCLYGWKDGAPHNWNADRKQTTVWDIERPSRSSEHPTMKPLALCQRSIKNSTKEKDIVLDIFLGSGSTLIACEQTNRICYGLEIDPKYCDVIRKRYAKFINKEEEWQILTPTI